MIRQHSHAPQIVEHEIRTVKESLKNQAKTQQHMPPRELIIKPERDAVDVNDLEEVQITGKFALTEDNNCFLLVDSRVENPVFFIVCSEKGLSRLRTYKIWASVLILKKPRVTLII